jgi:hypothetical protein
MKWRLRSRAGSGLQPSTQVAEAAWLGPHDAQFGFKIADLIREGFPAYVRVLHSARSRGDTPVRWATVADWSGRTMHGLAQFHAIANPIDEDRGPAPWDGHEPESGNLDIAALRALCDTLTRHTSTPARCWFCLWEGYGWLHGSPGVAKMTLVPAGRRAPTPQPVPPAFPAEVLNGPKVHRPLDRGYLLFEGPVSAAGELGHRIGKRFWPQSPNLFWPQDHAWCVATEIDLYCTVVAGSEHLAQELVTDPRLEAWRVQPSDSITYDSDLVNAY